jgi:peptidoglycan/LPS O-acetylase OafA/YrhL
MTTIPSERDRSIDIARMVAAFLIVLYHAGQSDSMVGGQPVLGFPPKVIIGQISLWGRVPFFFFLSGCFCARSLAKSGTDWWPFSRKRLIALVPPYLFWNLVCWLMLVVALRFGAEFTAAWKITPATALMQLTGFGMAPASQPLWFVRDLILASCLAPLMFRMGPWLLIPCLALTTFPEPSVQLQEMGVPRPSSFGYFGIGMLFRYFPRGTFGVLFPRPGPAMGICLAAGLACLLFKLRAPALVGPMVGAAGILLTARFIDQSFPKLANWLAANASASFLIFAANVPFFSLARQVYLKAHLPLPGIMYFACLALLFFLLGIWIHKMLRSRFPGLLLIISGGR